MAQKISAAIDMLRKAGYNFETGDFNRAPNGKTEGDVVYIFSTEKFQPPRDFDGGPSSNFKIVGAGPCLPPPRHAVICKIKVVNGHLTFFANPHPLFTAATKNMARLVKGSVSQKGIQANLECWENITDGWGAGFIGQ